MINSVCSKPKYSVILDSFISKNQRPKTQIQCSCQFCRTYQCKQFTKTLNIRQLHQSKKLFNILNQPVLRSHLQSILQKLVIPTNKIVTSSVNIYIPEICYFKQGNLKSFYINKDINDTLVKKTSGDKININTASKLLNQRRWHYRMAILNKKTTHAKIDSKQCIIVQFMDGYEKLLSELEFLQITQKRKQDPFWKSIYSFRNFISLSKEKVGRTIIKYKSNKNIIEQLFQRAQTVTLINSQNIVEDQNDQSQVYINDDSQETFCWMMIESGQIEYLFTYLTYKVIKFIFKFHDTQILKGQFYWVIDQLKRPVLIDVQKLQMKDLIKYDWTQKIIEQRKQQQHHNLFYKQNIHSTNQKDRYQCSIIQKQISQEYSAMKNYFQLKTNNDQYLKLIVKPKIKSNRQILNQKNKRKPLFRQFNSNLIRLSHSLIPNVKKQKVISFDNHVPVKQYSRKSIKSRHLSTNISQQIEFKQKAYRSVLLNRFQK